MSILKDNILYSKNEVASIVEGKEPVVYRLFDYVQKELKEKGDRNWLVDSVTGETIRLSGIIDKSRRVASGFKKLGLKPGDVVQIFYGTYIDFYWPVFGAWLCGGVISCCDPWRKPDILSLQIKDTRPPIVVTLKKFVDSLLEAIQMLDEEERPKHIFVLDADPDELLPGGTSSFRSIYNDDGSECPTRESLIFNLRDPLMINWTSGTTGLPKGVVHSQNYLHRMLSLLKSLPPATALTTAIMFHAYGFIFPLECGLKNGFVVTFVKLEDLNAKTCLKAIDGYNPAFLVCGSHTFNQIVLADSESLDLSSIQTIFPVGGTVYDIAVQKAKAKFTALTEVIGVYGATEVGKICSSPTPQILGHPSAGVEVYIRDIKTGEKLGPGKVGEIMVKTLTMMLGYSRNVELKNFTDEDGFAFMGDLGYYDDQGVLYYKERIKEVLKIDNFIYGPGEVEDVILKHPDVLDCSVFGTLNSNGFDDVNAAVVLAKESAERLKSHDRSKGIATILEDIKLFANNILSKDLKIKGKMFLLDEMPVSSQGKKLRREVKTRFTQL